jgi:predicted membrane protein (TIGR00267 family)
MQNIDAFSDEKHRHIRARDLIADSALGVSDGLITNLSFLTGFSGAISSIALIRVAGIAAMLAGSVSMFFGGLLATRSHIDLYRADSRREGYEIAHEPEEEKRELTNFYLEKGLTEAEAKTVVDRVTLNKEKWLEDMLIHELHLHKSELGNPYKKGVVIAFSFLVGSFVPLLPYLLLALKGYPNLVSLTTSLLFLFVVGAWKGRIVGRNIWRSSLEMLLVGVAGSTILYVIGAALVFV